MNIINNYNPNFSHVVPSEKSGSQDLNLTAILGIIAVIAICVVFIVVMTVLVLGMQRKLTVIAGKNGPESKKNLTPTQKFILAASSPTLGNNYKCVIDIWETRNSASEVEQVKSLFEWSWGDFTYENARFAAESCLNGGPVIGHNHKFLEYCSEGPASPKIIEEYNDFERALLAEMKEKYPNQGMLGWDFVRTLSIVGGAYMGGIMEYEEASRIALEACRLMQANFSSWDDMVGSYTLGYQLWRGKRKKDRLKYYKKLKRRSWIYNIAWETTLREEEL